MSKRPRRNHSAIFKAKVAVDAIKGEKTLAELAKVHDVHANQINDWKSQLLDRAASVFGAESAAAPAVDLKEPHAKIGQLALENDFLAGALNLARPFAGSRMLRDMLNREGFEVERRHVATLMQRMGIEALYRKPNTSKKHPTHKVYPYLLRELKIERANQVWATDITDIPMACGWVYLCAIVDWASRRVLSHRVSISMDASFWVEALEEAFSKYGKPESFNTDQGSQFTSEDFTGALKARGVAISMDGKGAWRDNVFVERLWRSIKYEEVYLHASDSVDQAKTGIARYINFYNTARPHSSLDKKTPDEFYFATLPAIERAA